MSGMWSREDSQQGRYNCCPPGRTVTGRRRGSRVARQTLYRRCCMVMTFGRSWACACGRLPHPTLRGYSHPPPRTVGYAPLVSSHLPSTPTPTLLRIPPPTSLACTPTPLLGHYLLITPPRFITHPAPGASRPLDPSLPLSVHTPSLPLTWARQVRTRRPCRLACRRREGREHRAALRRSRRESRDPPCSASSFRLPLLLHPPLTPPLCLCSSSCSSSK